MELAVGKHSNSISCEIFLWLNVIRPKFKEYKKITEYHKSHRISENIIENNRITQNIRISENIRENNRITEYQNIRENNRITQNIREYKRK
jgi:hypothetical protein